MSEHLREISSQVAPGAHCVLLCDGAGWHQRGGKLVVPENISLLPIPPYSPELNPMENVWGIIFAATNSVIAHGTVTTQWSPPSARKHGRF